MELAASSPGGGSTCYSAPLLPLGPQPPPPPLLLPPPPPPPLLPLLLHPLQRTRSRMPCRTRRHGTPPCPSQLRPLPVIFTPRPCPPQGCLKQLSSPAALASPDSGQSLNRRQQSHGAESLLVLPWVLAPTGC